MAERPGKSTGLSLRMKMICTFLLIGFITGIASGTGIYFSKKVGDFGVHVSRDLAPLVDAAMEIKLTSTPSYRDTEALRLFLEDYPETAAALLIHTGREIKRLHEKIVAVPWYLFSGEMK